MFGSQILTTNLIQSIQKKIEYS